MKDSWRVISWSSTRPSRPSHVLEVEVRRFSTLLSVFPFHKYLTPLLGTVLVLTFGPVKHKNRVVFCIFDFAHRREGGVQISITDLYKKVTPFFNSRRKSLIMGGWVVERPL